MSYKYPEHEKQRPIILFSQSIGEFIEWMESKKRIHLARVHHHGPGCTGWDFDRGRYNPDGNHRCGFHDGELYFANVPIDKLLAEFFEIDLKAIDREKEAMLYEMRALNEQK